MEKKKTNPDIRLFLDYAHVTYREKFGEKIYINGRCGTVIERLLNCFEIEKLKELWDKFLILSETDDFVAEAGCSIPVFESCINKLNSGRRKKKSVIEAYVNMEDEDHGKEGSQEGSIIPFSRISKNGLGR